MEAIVATELNVLGLRPRIEDGGAAFSGTIEAVCRSNLWLRTASRVIVRVARFRAQAFHELERLARAVAWERFVGTDATVRFRVTSRKSRLYHTGAIEQRLAEAVEHRLGRAVKVARPAKREDSDGDETAIGGQLFVIRVVHDVFTVSADTSGALLHQRGYRQAVGKAPLRETLAAAMLLGTGWDGAVPLLDPMCGSGTIAIEGALIARRLAPGLRRRFAFQLWPEVDQRVWSTLAADAEAVALPHAPKRILGSDRDTGAIQSARSNADRAGVSADVEFAVLALSAVDPGLDGAGSVVTNPPYGVRVGEAARLRDLYARFGQVLRSKCPSWRVTLLSANPRLDSELRLPLREISRTRNGGIPVRILTGEVPG